MPPRIYLFCILALAGCNDAPLPPVEAPTFLKTKPSTSLKASRVHWNPGERLAYQVRWRGLIVGTARLGVLGDAGKLRVESTFKTVGVANDMHPIRHRLVTDLKLKDGEYDDVHTALGRIRSWARVGAAPAKLTLRHENRSYELDLAGPILEVIDSKRRLRIEGRARALSTTIDLTLWLSADATHTPLLFTLIHNGQQVNATLIPSES